MPRLGYPVPPPPLCWLPLSHSSPTLHKDDHIFSLFFGFFGGFFLFFFFLQLIRWQHENSAFLPEHPCPSIPCPHSSLMSWESSRLWTRKLYSPLCRVLAVKARCGSVCNIPARPASPLPPLQIRLSFSPLPPPALGDGPNWASSELSLSCLRTCPRRPPRSAFTQPS